MTVDRKWRELSCATGMTNIIKLLKPAKNRICYIYSTSDGLYLIYNKGAWLLIESVRTRSITTPLYCKSDTDCHECCKWFVEWSNENCASWKRSGKFWAHGFAFYMRHNLKSNLKCRTSTFWSSHKKKRWNLSLKSRS